ncbi:MAG: serine/threonine-protein kinase [Pseudomonadota bacterium]
MKQTWPTLNDEQERQVLELLDALQDIDPAERSAYLELAAPDDDAVRTRVLKLLSETRQPVETGGGIQTLIGDDAPPARIGPWRVGEAIGRGGMGTVYRAVRDDGAFSQTVAVKMSRFSDETLSRQLQAETQLLSSLAHPNIAHVHDAGALDGERFYIVMEYIDGRPLSDVGAASTIKDRLATFDTILDAVAYAHRNGVVHRDLSPANILLREDGVVKVIDFGISQSVGSAEAAAWSAARTAGFTAPERLTGARGDTRADIYSLGKLLSFLVEGTSPPRSRDLNAIVAKASAEDPSARYASIEGLREDLHRYQNGQAVTVIESSAYRLKRLFTRFPFASAATAATLVAIIGGLVVTSFALSAARRNEAKAVERFDALSELSRTVMTDVFGQIETVPGTEPAQKAIVEIVAGYLEQLEADPRADSALRLDIADVHLNLAWLKGYGVADLQFDPAEAEGHWQAAMARLEALRKEGLRSERFYAAMAWASLWRGQRLAIVEYDPDAALITFREGLAIVDEAFDAFPNSSALYRRKLGLQTGVADILVRGDDVDASQAAYEAINQTAEQAKGVLKTSIPFEQIAIAQRGLSRLRQRERDVDAAVSHLDLALQAIEAGYGTEEPRRSPLIRSKARTDYSLANIKRNLGDDPEETIEAYQQAIESHEAWSLLDPTYKTPLRMIPILKSEMAVPLATLKRRPEALAALRPQMDIDLAAYAEDPERALNIENVIFSYDTAIDVYIALEDQQTACSYAVKLLDMVGAFGDPSQITTTVNAMIEDAKTLRSDCGAGP